MSYETMKKITLLTIKDLVEKMSTCLANSGEIQSYLHNFVRQSRTSSDFMVPQIVEKVNKVVSSTVEFNDDIKTRINDIYLYGIHKKRGNLIHIMYRDGNNIDKKRLAHLSRLIQDICHSFGYSKAVRVDVVEWKGSFFKEQILQANNVIAKVGIGREIRESGLYLPEAILLVILLYFNSNFYQAFKLHPVTGRQVRLPVFTKTIIKGLSKLAKLAKPLPMPASIMSNLLDHEDSVAGRAYSPTRDQLDYLLSHRRST